MKVFSKSEGWGSKTNFVDDHNVLVGYDMGQSCCEYADWFIADKVTDSHSEGDGMRALDLEGYSFDKGFFLEHDKLMVDGCGLDEGGCVVFKMTNGDNDKYLHLFNCHNGYYGHGFVFKDADKILQEGGL